MGSPEPHTGQKIRLRKGEAFELEDTAALSATHCRSEPQNWQETHFHRHVGCREENFLCRNRPVVPAWQLVHTTSFVRGTMAQLEPPGHGQGWQSEAVPAVASP